jgi:hypothetical protein
LTLFSLPIYLFSTLITFMLIKNEHIVMDTRSRAGDFKMRTKNSLVRNEQVVLKFFIFSIFFI